MSDQFVAEIRIFPFNFPPTGWAFCQGQLMPISQNTALFALLGTTYGGDGKSTFALPDMQGNTPMQPGQGQGLSLRDLGEMSGVESITLLQSEMPLHTHTQLAQADPANLQIPTNTACLTRSSGGNAYSTLTSGLVSMAFQTAAPAGRDDHPAELPQGQSVGLPDPVHLGALADSVDPFYVGIIPGWPVPPCPIGQQAILAAAAGATAFVSNLISPDDAYAYSPGVGAKELAGVGIPVIQIADIDDIADAIRATPGADTMTITAQTPSWGYIRVFRENGTSEWQQVGRFTDAPNAFGVHPTPPGSWSVHNTEVLGNRAYSAWYSNGIVAIDLSNPTAPTRVGQFVPTTSRRHANSLGVGPAEVWGVAIDPATGIVYASDMRTGLWIVEPTGPAKPS